MNQKRFASIILVIAVIAFLGVVGYFGVVRKSEPVIKQSPTPSSETADWETYRNEVYGLEVKRPANWSIVRENKDISLRNSLKQYGGDKVEVVVLSEKSGSNVAITYFGTNLNFSDCSSRISQEECLKLREANKMGLDQFMEFAERNSAFQNVKKGSLSGYTAYEIDFRGRVSEDGGKTYHERNAFAIMVENESGVFQINFADRLSKNDLSSTELQFLSTLKFLK